MSFVDKMEKNVFFKIVRWFAFIASFIGFIAIIAGVFLFIHNFSNIFPSSKVKVEFSDVQATFKEKESTRVEEYNKMANLAIKHAYTVAQAYFNQYPSSIVSLDILRNLGLDSYENVEITILNGDSNSLRMTTKHKKGNVTYYIDALGTITNSTVTSATSPLSSANNSKLTGKESSAKNNEIEDLVNRIISYFPSPKYNEGKLREFLYNMIAEFKEEYQIQYLKDLNGILNKAPADEKLEYLGYFTEIFKKKVTDVTTNKEIKQLSALKDFTIFAGIIFVGIMIIALFGLILVLLAIERNTRKNEAQN